MLYKRKPVPFPEPPSLPDDLNVKCWYIAYTKEWFLTYDEYLKRLDYYNTRKFVCEITGNSCLTFFEAYESEKKEMEIVEKNFPEHLKEPILRHLQFSTVPRIDQLVDDVYTTFKNDYYPGEAVMIRLNDYKNDFKTRCIIREKAKFNAVVDANNNYRPAYCQYRVSRCDDNVEVVVDENQITRDRTNFTKWFVKTFIKLSVSRSPKIGAPWIVKSKYASKYRIPTELPPELAHFKEKPPAPPRRRTPQPLRPKNSANGKTPEKKFVPIVPNGSKLRNILPAPNKGKPTIIKTASPPPPKRTVEEDLSQPLDSLVKRPKPHQLKQLEDCVQEALESWTFLNVYRVPLLLDTFTFDDFLTAMRWNSTNKRCVLLDEIFCAVLSSFMGEKNQDLLVTLPEEFDMSDFGEDEKEQEVKKEVKTEEKTNGDGESDAKKEEGETKENGTKVEEDDKEKIEDKEENDDDDEEFEDAVVEQHNVEKYLEYRGISWQERLQKRNFKDGNWQIILVGVLDLVRDIKDYQATINETFETLAPLDTSVTPNAILTQFLTETSANLRIKILNILCSLLVNSPAIRQYLDKCMSESTDLRRERLEKLREYKSAFERAQNTDKELRELAGAGSSVPSSANNEAQSQQQQQQQQGTPSSETIETKKRRRRTGLSKEPTEQELAISKINPQYATLLAARTAQLKISEDLRIQRRNLEKKIVELDVQRIRYLGKDRLYNRYWWFENNGLPNLGGSGKSSGGADEDNDGGADEDEDEDEDDEDDEFLNETYLMGRLWIQGPTNEDAFMHFKLTPEKVKEWISTMESVSEEKIKGEEGTKNDEDEEKDENETQEEIKEAPKLPKNFVESAEKVFQLTFDQEKRNIKSSTENRTLVDEYGAAAENLQPIQRKIIEENPDPLLTTKHWRFYDNASEIEDLLKWLNPWGERETKLLKELNTVKDQIVSSVQSRRKALRLDSKTQDEEELTREIGEIIISDSEDEESSSSSSSDSDIEILSGSDSAEPEFLGVGEEEQPRTRRSIAAAEKIAEERRQKEVEIRQRIAERQAKKERSRPGRRIARREQKKRKLKEHDEKKRHKAQLLARLENIKEDNEVQRCLDWVNQSVVEALGHTHYEGPKRAPPPRSRRGRR